MAAAATTGVVAQPAKELPRVALVFTDSRLADMIGPEPASQAARAFIQRLRDLGWVEGRNVAIERRSAEGRRERLSEIMSEIVASRVDVIFTVGDGAVHAQRATSSIPIVFYVDDPIRLGFTTSLARPDRNLTGVTSAPLEIYGRRLQMLHQAAPRARRIAVLDNSGVFGPVNPYQRYVEVQLAAKALGLQLVPVGADGAADFEAAFASIVRERAEALLVGATNPNRINAARIADFAARQRLPAMASGAQYVRLGLLMSYGEKDFEAFRAGASYVDKILRGAKPADLPIQRPLHLELSINLKTARSLGLTLPQSLLLRADEVIE